MSEFVKFYQGTESEYETIKLNGMLEDYFYFTKDETDGRYRLRLKEQLIYSSNDKEDIAEKVMGSKKFQEEIAKYLPITGGTMSGNLIVNNAVKVNSLEATNNISATNFKHNSQSNTVTIPCTLIVNGNTTVNATLTLNKINVNEGGTLKKCTLEEVGKITFSNTSTLTNLPNYENNGFSFNFNEGNLNVNSISANSIYVNGKPVITSQEEAATKVYKNIQIGNIILSDDGNGNLAITSVENNSSN